MRHLFSLFNLDSRHSAPHISSISCFLSCISRTRVQPPSFCSHISLGLSFRTTRFVFVMSPSLSIAFSHSLRTHHDIHTHILLHQLHLSYRYPMRHMALVSHLYNGNTHHCSKLQNYIHYINYHRARSQQFREEEIIVCGRCACYEATRNLNHLT